MIPIYPKVLDNSEYVLSLEETVRYSLFQVLFDSGLLKGLTDRARDYDKVGKDSKCLWSEVFYYYDLIDYMVLTMTEIRQSGAVCGTDEFQAKLDSYNLDCIKKTLLCRYGSSGVLDSLKNNLVEVFIQRLELCCDSGEGISIMNINSPSCNTFTVYPAS